jgi:hypothetical protein
MYSAEFINIVAPSVQVTSGAASAFITIPNDASGNMARAIRIATKSNVYVLPHYAPLATGSITFTGVPANNDTITVNSTVITWKTSGATGNEVNIQPTAVLNARALWLFLSQSSNANIRAASYDWNTQQGDTQIRVTARTAGTGGNSFTLTESTANMTVSGATLTGGSETAATAANSVLIKPGESLLLRCYGITGMSYIQETSASIFNISPIEVG